MLIMLVFSSNIGEDGVAATGLTGHISPPEIGVDGVVTINHVLYY